MTERDDYTNYCDRCLTGTGVHTCGEKPEAKPDEPTCLCDKCGKMVTEWTHIKTFNYCRDCRPLIIQKATPQQLKYITEHADEFVHPAELEDCGERVSPSTPLDLAQKIRQILESDGWHIGDGVDDCSGWDEEAMADSIMRIEEFVREREKHGRR